MIVMPISVKFETQRSLFNSLSVSTRDELLRQIAETYAEKTNTGYKLESAVLYFEYAATGVEVTACLSFTSPNPMTVIHLRE